MACTSFQNLVLSVLGPSIASIFPAAIWPICHSCNCHAVIHMSILCASTFPLHCRCHRTSLQPLWPSALFECILTKWINVVGNLVPGVYADHSPVTVVPNYDAWARAVPAQGVMQHLRKVYAIVERPACCGSEQLVRKCFLRAHTVR